MPSPVDKYFKEVKDKNPSYTDEQAWATAWSVFCKHVKPGSNHCHKDSDEYLKGKSAGMIVRVASRFRTATEFTQEELAILSIMEGIKPSYRAKDMEHARLGEYGPNNPHIQSLMHKGLIKIQGGKALVLDKAKAVKVMKENPIPDKYRGSLTNPQLQFKRREE